MEKTRQVYSQASGHAADNPLSRGIEWGLIGGLAGTIVMDLCLIGAFSVAGLPALTCFSVVGDTVARFFTVLGNAVTSFSATLGLEIAGGVPLGVAAHYVIGPAIGASFGAAVTKIGALRLDSMKKSVVLSVLYVEILSQPLLAAMPILLGWTLLETLQWYGGALLAHSVAGAVLGSVTHRGLCWMTGGERGTAPRSGSRGLVI